MRVRAPNDVGKTYPKAGRHQHRSTTTAVKLPHHVDRLHHIRGEPHANQCHVIDHDGRPAQDFLDALDTP